MLLAKYRVDRHLSAAQLKAVEQQFIEILNLAYTLSRELLEGGRSGKAAEEKFNRTFKAI